VPEKIDSKVVEIEKNDKNLKETKKIKEPAGK
jgi:hypothetical protein